LDFTLKHRILVINSVSYPDPAFYLNADPDSDPGNLTMRALVKLCRHKKMDFDMKNFVIKILILIRTRIGYVFSNIPESGPDLESAKTRISEYGSETLAKICSTPNVPLAVKFFGQPVH
jgi:hypothetical protein